MPEPDITIVRRLGSTPQQRGSLNNGTCPDLFELTDGDIAVIGDDCEITDEVTAALAKFGARLGDQRIVIVSRAAIMDAKSDLPEP